MKAMIYFSILVFSTVGSYIPTLFHQSFLSMGSILGGAVGGFFGIWLVIKYKDYF